MTSKSAYILDNNDHEQDSLSETKKNGNTKKEEMYRVELSHKTKFSPYKGIYKTSGDRKYKSIHNCFYSMKKIYFLTLKETQSLNSQSPQLSTSPIN